MGADEVLGRARVNTQEVAIVPFALHLLPIVLVGGKLEQHLFTEYRDGLQTFVPGDIIATRAAVHLDPVSTNHICHP